VLLHEAITPAMIAGTALIVAGTIVVLRPARALSGT
jgi:drug/metabolite transporter (DMT)-like permease